jgi:hypothetical protein
MALSAFVHVGLDSMGKFLREETKNVDVFLQEFPNQSAESLISWLKQSKGTTKHSALSDGFRIFVKKVEDSGELAPARQGGGRRKRTLRKKNRKHQK